MTAVAETLPLANKLANGVDMSVDAALIVESRATARSACARKSACAT
jgi:hypothetical protein